MSTGSKPSEAELEARALITELETQRDIALTRCTVLARQVAVRDQQIALLREELQKREPSE